MNDFNSPAGTTADSLGREPQVCVSPMNPSPGGAAQLDRRVSCRPVGAWSTRDSCSPGLTPGAIIGRPSGTKKRAASRLTRSASVRPRRWDIVFRPSHASCFTVLLATIIMGNAFAQQSVTPRERLTAHTQASVLANELVTSIFDVQLRHLKENGLAELPLYTDIRTSRDRVDQLASNEMEQLTRLLKNLLTEPVEKRDELLAEARLTARQIAIAMMAQRQRLRGRLRTARTIMLVRQLIALEKQAIVATDRLKSLPNAERQRLAEQLVQSHLDLAVLFKQLMLVLRRATEMAAPDRISV